MVDIIIPFYNRKHLLKKAIQSVQEQTFKNWVLWLVDDGSQEDMGDLKKEFQSEKIKFLSLQTNQGVSAARNKGIKAGQNPWIAFLDSDDKWLPKKLETQINFAQQHPQYPLIHCNEIWIKNGQPLNQKKKHKKQGGRVFIPSTLLCCISPSATLVKRSLLNKVGLFREDFPVCEDYDLWLRITSSHSVGFVEPALLIKYGGHSDQLSQAYPAMDYWRVQALKTHINNPNLSTQEQEHLKKVLLKKCNILLKGYEKHKNFTNQQEVTHIKQSITNPHPKSKNNPNPKSKNNQLNPLVL